MKNTKQTVTLALVLIILTSIPALAAEPSDKAYLSPEELLDLYESMYSRIHNIKFSCTKWLDDEKSDPRVFETNLTRSSAVERIEEGQKYRVRWTGNPGGFAEAGPSEVAESAFNGSITTEYLPESKVGTIIGGRTGKAPEIMNPVWHLMHIHKTRPNERTKDKYPDGRIFIRTVVGNWCFVRPRLEQVNGQLCHVVDNAPGNQRTVTVWFATDKNALPMKVERYRQGKCIYRTEITKIASVETDTGTIWYPQEATMSVEHDFGTAVTNFHISSFVPNVQTSQDTFRLAFPPGTEVVDEVAGIYYTTAPFDEKTKMGVLDGYDHQSQQHPAPPMPPDPTPEPVIKPAPKNTSHTPDAHKELPPAQQPGLAQTKPSAGPVIKIVFAAVIAGFCLAAISLYRKRFAKNTD